jgi:hypothetical protein
MTLWRQRAGEATLAGPGSSTPGTLVIRVEGAEIHRIEDGGQVTFDVKFMNGDRHTGGVITLYPDRPDTTDFYRIVEGFLTAHGV